MILSALKLAVALQMSPALAEDTGISPGEVDVVDVVDDPLARHRTSFPELAERTIGTASQPVEFNWRRTKVHAAATGSQLFELNNFNSLRVGGLARFPAENMLVELGVSYVRTWDTPSSRLLAYTPYRQPGRPDRMEIDISVGIPLAEGVVTLTPRFLPALQLVLNAYVDFRYLLYPDGFAGMNAGKVLTSVLAPSFTQAEFDNLEDRRLNAMKVDSGRYGLMIGMGNDIYFKQGFFLSPRVMFSLPVLEPLNQTDLVLTGEFSLAIGVAR